MVKNMAVALCHWVLTWSRYKTSVLFDVYYRIFFLFHSGIIFIFTTIIPRIRSMMRYSFMASEKEFQVIK